ncbi:hypothetical protein D3C73_1410600 [compost metagenome]
MVVHETVQKHVPKISVSSEMMEDGKSLLEVMEGLSLVLLIVFVRLKRMKN